MRWKQAGSENLIDLCCYYMGMPRILRFSSISGTIRQSVSSVILFHRRRLINIALYISDRLPNVCVSVVTENALNKRESRFSLYHITFMLYIYIYTNVCLNIYIYMYKHICVSIYRHMHTFNIHIWRWYNFCFKKLSVPGFPIISLSNEFLHSLNKPYICTQRILSAPYCEISGG